MQDSSVYARAASSKWQFQGPTIKPCAIMQANVPQEEVLDPAEAKRRAIEAEEARLAAQRAHGTQVTPETFVDWQKRFDAEQALQKARWPTPSFYA